MLELIKNQIKAAEFQSAPDREAGRCPCATASTSSTKRFQSAPDREAGRCLHPGLAALFLHLVSIRARP